MQQAALSRVHQSVLAHHERQTMIRLARRLPAWVTPDHMTLLGLGGALVCGASYAACLVSPRFLWLACLGLVLNWLGDSLDGNLARVRGTERPRYGFFVDHSADVIAQLLIFLGLGLSPFMRFDMALLALLSYWLAALYTFIRAVATRVFQISYFGVGPTEIRLGLLAYSLLLPLPDPFALATPFGRFAPIDAIVLVTFCAVVLMFLLAVYGESRRLAALEPSPRAAQAPTPRAAQATLPRAAQAPMPRAAQATSPRAAQAPSPRAAQAPTPPGRRR